MQFPVQAMESVARFMSRSRGRGRTFTVRRTFLPAVVAAALEPYEPRTSQALSDLHSTGLRPMNSKAWIVERDGSLAAVVLVVKRAFDLWFAHALLVDVAAAEIVAGVIDDGQSIAVNGAAPDVNPLLPFLGRLQNASVLPWIVEEFPHEILQAPDVRTRVATLADLDQLVDLYRDYEYGYERTIGQLRTTIRRLLQEHLIIVAEDDGRISGASFIAGRTRRYVVGDGLTVRPGARGNSAMWRIASRMQSIVNSMGLGAMAFLAASNPILIDTIVADDQWITTRLHPRRRFPGHNRLRNMLYARHARRHRTPTLFRDPTDPDNQYVPTTELTSDGKLVRG